MTITLPQGTGTAIFAGGGAWLPHKTALALSEPCHVLMATTPEEIPTLLNNVELEQSQGRFVAGYLSYEAGAAFGLTVRDPAPDALPLAWMGIYEPGSAVLIPNGEWHQHLSSLDVSRVADTLAGVKPRLSVSRDEYVRAIRRVREFIAAGDTYQVNYTVRGYYDLATGTIDPLDYFLALLVRQPVPYAAYLDLGNAQIISLSPEMFLRRDGNCLESRPMKGTRPRAANHVEDVALAYELAETEKERAENLMIVDMVRNDLGRVCRTGTVNVPTLYAVEPYRTVWQMVSTVTGQVHPQASLQDIMRAVFPGASITGAPKHHTMEIIAALETEPRDVYTGALGIFRPGGDFTCNIAIRTIIHRRGRCTLGTGSGVVWDAVAGAEYEETLTKAAFATPPTADTWRPDPVAHMRTASRTKALDDKAPGGKTSDTPLRMPEDLYIFETILLEAREGDATVESPGDLTSVSPSFRLSREAVLARYVFLDDHLNRLAASAIELGFPFNQEEALDLLTGLARLTPQEVAVRIELDPRGILTQSARNIQPWDMPFTAPAKQPVSVTLMLSSIRTDPDDPLMRHKTSLRGFYNREHKRAVDLGCIDALFLNRLDHVTEGAITSVAARFGDSWVTPPLEDGLLPGIWRAHLISGRKAVESSLTLAELLSADEIVVGNSVRGAVRVNRLLTDPVVF